MIPKKYKADDLIGKKCRPLRNIRNGGGDAVSPDSVCIIVAAHYGISIKTPRCPHCGQYCYITRIKREDLELVEE